MLYAKRLKDQWGYNMGQSQVRIFCNLSTLCSLKSEGDAPSEISIQRSMADLCTYVLLNTTCFSADSNVVCCVGFHYEKIQV